MPPPSWAAGITSLGFMIYPTYRLAVVGIVAVALLALYLVLYRTRLGMIVRAGIEDSVMVDSLGINVMRVFMMVFGIGAMAAGFAGIVNVPIAPMTPDIGESILVEAFVVVVIGGVGSFPGAVLGGLIAGEILSLTSMIDPSYSQVMLFAVMTLVLVLRPRGLLGVEGRSVTMDQRSARAASRPARSVDRARAAGRAVRPPAARVRSRHDEPHPRVRPVRRRLRFAVRLHRDAVLRPVGVLRHRRLHRGLSADADGLSPA